MLSQLAFTVDCPFMPKLPVLNVLFISPHVIKFSTDENMDLVGILKD